MCRRHIVGGLLGIAASAALPGELCAQGTQLLPQTLAGSWRGLEVGPMGRIALSVVFFPNGTYRRTSQLRDLMGFDVGQYSIVQNWIHFTLSDYGPRIYKGRPMTRPMSDTWIVDYFDRNSLRASVGGTSMINIRRM